MIDINFFDIFGNFRETLLKQVEQTWSYQGPTLPSDPLQQYLFLENVRRQAAMVR